MTSRQTVASEAALIPPFLGKRSCNVTFVLDSSESMRAVLGSVKRLLIQTLLTKASLRDSLFNIMTYAGKVNCWSPHMLPCAPDTVYSALSWIHSISCSPGRDLLAALSVGLSDQACHAVHLLCTGLPDQPEAVLRALPALAAGRPVHVFCLQDSRAQLDSDASDYLQCLAQATRGSCYAITTGSSGKLEKVIPLYVAESPSSVPTVSTLSVCCSPTSLTNTPAPLLRCSLGNPLWPATSCVLSGQTLAGSEFFPGCRVLARREDGLYYLGSVIQQVQGRTGVWLVEFDRPASPGSGALSSQRQLVCSLDMVNHVRVHSLCLAPGDPVLSPWEPDLKRYGPGRVMAATEHRGFGVDVVRSLRVLMWNGCVSLVPDSLVSPMSASHHDRTVRELQIPTCRPSRRCNWLYGRSSSCPPQLSCTRCCQSSPCCCSVSNHWSCLPPPSWRSSLGQVDGFERVERDTQADLKNTDVRKSDPEVPSSSASSLSEDDTGAAAFPSAVKLKRIQRPPWRYWRRTGPEPHHTQPANAVPRRTSQPGGFSFPVPQISASPNHTSLFQSLPGATGRRANIRDVLGMTKFKPQPPAGLQPFSGNNATTVLT